MVSAVSSLLAKVAILERQAERLRPIDHLAHLTNEQRKFYANWWNDFKAQNTAKPSSLYEATLTQRGYTPNIWLNYPRITTDMSITDCAEIWRDQLGE